MIIHKNDFLEKYSFFKETKDNLTIINNLTGWYFVHQWYIIDDYFIPYSNYFNYCWDISDMNENNFWLCNFMLTWSIIYLFENISNNTYAMKFDLENIQHKNKYRDWELWWWWRWLKEFDIDKLLWSHTPILSEKIRVNPKFDSILNNSIYKTEFYYQPIDFSLSIEEITDNIFQSQYINRYLHCIFEPQTRTIKHFDWSYLIYDKNSKEIRKTSSLDKKTKNACKHIKLFRIDWTINIIDWQHILLRYFCNNELIQERFDPVWYKEDYWDILEKDLDY